MASVSATMFYTLNDFNEIAFGSELEYSLDAATLAIIDKLAAEIGVSNSVVVEKRSANSHHLTNSNDKTTAKRSKHYSRKDVAMEESWIQPAFKATVIEKKDNAMSEIRTCLNKLSAKNYDANKDALLQMVRSVDAEHLPAIANNIFDIASTNQFYSEIYANLYKELLGEFAVFSDILHAFVGMFTETMREIRYIDPDKNYDEFCEYNKQNAARKATTTFISNLLKVGVLEKSVVLGILCKIQEIMGEYMDQSERTNEVEEITENVYLMVTKIWDGSDSFEPVHAKIVEIAQSKAKSRPSLTSRAIFKHMDMLDFIKKYGK